MNHPVSQHLSIWVQCTSMLENMPKNTEKEGSTQDPPRRNLQLNFTELRLVLCKLRLVLCASFFVRVF